MICGGFQLGAHTTPIVAVQSRKIEEMFTQSFSNGLFVFQLCFEASNVL